MNTIVVGSLAKLQLLKLNTIVVGLLAEDVWDYDHILNT